MSQVQPFHGFISMQARGLVALPTAIRKRYRLDEPGAQLEVTERPDGVIELRPMQAIPAHEAWFWDSRWQVGELEVDVLVAQDRVVVSDGPEAFIESLHASVPE